MKSSNCADFRNLKTFVLTDLELTLKCFFRKNLKRSKLKMDDQAII